MGIIYLSQNGKRTKEAYEENVGSLPLVLGQTPRCARDAPFHRPPQAERVHPPDGLASQQTATPSPAKRRSKSTKTSLAISKLITRSAATTGSLSELWTSSLFPRPAKTSAFCTTLRVASSPSALMLRRLPSSFARSRERFLAETKFRIL